MPKYLLEDMIRDKRARQQTKEIKKEPIKEPKKNAIKDIQKNVRREWTEVGVARINNAKSKSRYMLWFVAVISAAFCLFALSFLFGKAEILVNPKTQEVALNENLSASKDSGGDAISFDLVIIPGVENKTIQATAEKDVAIKAIGTIVIYNTFSSASQSLNIGTRLEGSNGKIYRTQAKTVVPGVGKNGSPGSVEVGIYGELAGDSYNSDPLDFKILGFKGTPKYAKFYGRSKGAITGGFVGKAPDITDADKATAISDLKNTLQAKLLQKATGQIPNGFILFKDAVFLNTDDTNNNINNQSNISSTNNSDNSMTLSLKGTLYGILFNEQNLTKKVAGDVIDKYDGSDVYIPNIRGLTFALSNKDNISFDNLQNIDFSLSGPAKFVWKLDMVKFTADLLGKSKKDFNQILSQYPNIDSAILKLSFPWMQSIPSKVKDIKVIVNYPK